MALSCVHILLVSVSIALLFQVHRVSTGKCETVNFVRPALLGGTETVKAAHCMQKKDSETELLPNEVVVRLGAHNLTDPNEKGVIQMNVSAIIVHPDWKVQVFEKRYDADIAILVLSANITFTDYIQPARMPANGTVNMTDNMEGTVVGYSARNERAYAETPRRIVVRAVSKSHCFLDDKTVAAYSSNRTFCGGHGDGSPDLGDSGSGYFFTPGFSWAQYGILSIVHTNRTGHIYPRMYHLYTNVSSFKDWIIENVNRTGGVVGEARISITMRCDYDYSELIDSAESHYGCTVHNIDIQGNNFETGSFDGTHLYRKRHHDVEEIQFLNGTMTHLPSGFGLFFENIKHLTVARRISDSTTMGTKAVRRSDLQNLRKLRRLSFFRNDIHRMHENASWDLPNLQDIEFIENKLTVLHNETFSKNKKLMKVDFHSNRLNFLPAKLFRNNPLLEAVDFRDNLLTEIDEKFFKTNRRLTEISFDSNKLEMLPERLFRNNFLLLEVHFRNNFLKAIDETFFETNRRLRTIDFSLNQLEALPKRLFQNSLSLRSVDFESNVLSSLDEDLFETNVKLENVLVQSNRIESLPQKLFRNNSLLVGVNFRNNFLKTIDENFFEANEMLRSVDFSSNHLESLPKRLFRNSLSLRSVNFGSNVLSSIDENFFGTNVKLENADFASNRIESLSRTLFRNNSFLLTVNFRNNFIKTIDEKIFEANKMLWSVDLGFNHLEALPKHLFRNSLSLHTVNFGSNVLSSIDEDLFETNVNLMVTNFTSNRIHSLSRTLFRNNLRLYIVDFRNNSMTEITDNLFVNNRKLYLIGFGDNRLERVQKDVIKSVSLLDMLDLNNVDIVSTEFEKVCDIDLGMNDCVNEPYSKQIVRTKDLSFSALTDFQELVIENCSNGM